MSSDYFDPSAKDSALEPNEQQRLDEARRLMATHKPGQAAPLFAKLAEVLASAGQPQRAAHLHADAALAFAESHNESAALPQARSALNLFLKYKMERAPLFYAQVSAGLTRHGLPEAAAALEKEFGARMPKNSPAGTPLAARLPGNCPQCGAAVGSEAPRNDDGSVNCVYCGARIQPLG